MTYKYDENERVQDSTNGRSLLRPIKYKKDVLMQVRLDSRVLATLSMWIDRHGFGSRFLSEAVSIPLEMLVDHLVENEEVQIVDDTMEARILLESKYRVKLNVGDRGRKNLAHNALLSEQRRAVGSISGDRIGLSKRDVYRPIEDGVKEDVEVRAAREGVSKEIMNELDSQTVEATEIYKNLGKQRLYEEHREMEDKLERYKKGERFEPKDKSDVFNKYTGTYMPLEELREFERERLRKLEEGKSKVETVECESKDEVEDTSGYSSAPIKRSKELIDEDMKRALQKDKELAEMDMAAPVNKIVK